MLFNNPVPDDDLSNMWAQFKMQRLHRFALEHATESIKVQLLENERDELDTLFSEEDANITRLLALLRESPLLQDNFWHLLFIAIRDREVDMISEEKRIPILEGGQVKHMSMTDIEQKFILENRDILTAQRCIPDQMIHYDLIDAHFNTESVRESLKRSYEKKLTEAKTALAEDNPKLSKAEVAKQAAAQAKTETKESGEAYLLQHRVAMKAEDEAQKSILAAMKEFGIPVYVFRGVNTYDDIGKFLQGFDMKMSRLKAFKSGYNWGTLEWTHDIGIVALLPSGPLVSFVQVIKS